jgi:hypothetical protein
VQFFGKPETTWLLQSQWRPWVEFKARGVLEGRAALAGKKVRLAAFEAALREAEEHFDEMLHAENSSTTEEEEEEEEERNEEEEEEEDDEERELLRGEDEEEEEELEEDRVIDDDDDGDDHVGGASAPVEVAQPAASAESTAAAAPAGKKKKKKASEVEKLALSRSVSFRPSELLFLSSSVMALPVERKRSTRNSGIGAGAGAEAEVLTEAPHRPAFRLHDRVKALWEGGPDIFAGRISDVSVDHIAGPIYGIKYVPFHR